MIGLRSTQFRSSRPGRMNASRKRRSHDTPSRLDMSWMSASPICGAPGYCRSECSTIGNMKKTFAALEYLTAALV